MHYVLQGRIISNVTLNWLSLPGSISACPDEGKWCQTHMPNMTSVIRSKHNCLHLWTLILQQLIAPHSHVKICSADFNHTVQKPPLIYWCHTGVTFSVHPDSKRFNCKPGVSLSDISIPVKVRKPFTVTLSAIHHISETDIICPHNQTAAHTNTDSKHRLLSGLQKHGQNDDALCWRKTINTFQIAVRLGWIQTQPMKPSQRQNYYQFLTNIVEIIFYLM